jgi:hypothetical protein
MTSDAMNNAMPYRRPILAMGECARSVKASNITSFHQKNMTARHGEQAQHGTFGPQRKRPDLEFMHEQHHAEREQAGRERACQRPYAGADHVIGVGFSGGAVFDVVRHKNNPLNEKIRPLYLAGSPLL